MKQLYLIFLLAFFAGSCDYLDITPTGMVIPEKLTEYRALLTSAYERTTQHKVLLAVRSDEAFPYNWDGYGSYDDYIDVATWNDAAIDPLAKAYPWTSVYKIIFYANTVIDHVMAAPVDTREETREQVLAEAYLLRAYYHFELLNLYAKPYDAQTATTDKGVPLSLHVDVEQEYISSSVEQVYTQILEDLREGQHYMQLEKQPLAYRYRFSAMAAKALEARIRLYRSEWELALQAAQELLPGCELEDLNDPDARSPYYYDSKESILAMERVVNIDIVADMYMLDNTMEKYNLEKDLRVERYFKWDGEHYVPDKCNGDDMKVTFRSGEVYLIAAEAAAHTEGKLDVAKSYLKQLMVKRLSPDYYEQRAKEIDRMNREECIAEIADERVRELALEGHRWYDLRRTTRPEITKTYLDKQYNSHTVTLRKEDVKYTIPFPKEATENNPNLTK